jgi:hypothetical protein
VYDVLRHLNLEPFKLFLVALGTVVAIRLTAGPISRSRPPLVRLALYLCVGGAIAALALPVCFAAETPMVVQEKIATAGLLMTMVGGVLFLSVYRSEGDDPPPPDDERWDLPDDPGGDHAYPWWPEFERELRDYEAVGRQAAGSTVRVRA